LNASMQPSVVRSDLLNLPGITSSKVGISTIRNSPILGSCLRSFQLYASTKSMVMIVFRVDFNLHCLVHFRFVRCAS
jgi:hypothetical protein